MAISAAIMGALGASARLGDLYYSNVALLLHANGINGATSFIDNSPSPKTVTTVDGSISTAQAKFGPSSLICGSGIYYDATLAAITGDFTAECFVFFTSSPSYATLINLGGGYNAGFLFRQTNGTNVEIFFQTSSQSFAFTPSLNTWYHYAVSRIGGVFRFFVNGVQIGSNWNTSANIPSGVCRLGQSSHSGSEVLRGHLDEIRITIGIGRYDSAFTPPVSAFSDKT